MKRRLIFAVLLTVVLVCSMWGSYKTNIVYAVGQKDATVYIYCQQYNGLSVGSRGYVRTNYINFYKSLQNAKGVDGVTVVIDKSGVDVGALLKKLQVNQTYSQQTDDFTCIYGYTQKIRNFVLVDGCKVNVQIAITPNQIHVGSPLLLGSY